MKQLFRFLVVGVFNTLFGYGIIFTCLYLLKMTAEASNATGYGISLYIAYLLHRNFTFKSKQRKRGEVTRFFVVFCVAYVSNFVTLVLLIHKLGLDEGMSQVLAGVAYVTASYLMNKYYVFKQSDS